MIEEKLDEVISALWDISSEVQSNKLSDQADGTNWTIADSISNAVYQLERIADVLEQIEAKMK
jgi:hypothetical protein